MKVNDISFFNSKKEVVISEDNGFEKPLDGSKLYNVKPPFYVIDFTSSNQDGIVAWSENNMEATFTHTLNCYPVVTVYDSNGELSQPVVTVLSGNSFKLSFCSRSFSRFSFSSRARSALRSIFFRCCCPLRDFSPR